MKLIINNYLGNELKVKEKVSKAKAIKKKAIIKYINLKSNSSISLDRNKQRKEIIHA